jgi:hypothetical protein
LRYEFNPFTGSFDFIGIWKCFNNTIPAGQTVVVDSGLLSSLSCNTYHFAASGSGNNRKYNFQLVNDSGSLKDSLTKLGSTLNINFNSVINGLNYEVRVTNNEAFAINLSTAKLTQ